MNANFVAMMSLRRVNAGRGTLAVLSVAFLVGAALYWLVSRHLWPSDARGSQSSSWTNAKDRSELVYVAAGPFTMGSDNGEIDEYPPHRVNLPAYWIGKYPVTNEQFTAFLNEMGNKYEHGVPWIFIEEMKRKDVQAIHRYPSGKYYVRTGYERHPVAGVSWFGAKAYCRWAGVRLPTEAEWEKAARGTDGRKFPWGNAWNSQNAGCTPRNKIRTSKPSDDWQQLSKPAYIYIGTSDIAAHPGGASPYGCMEMTGNVWQWCSSLYAEYPYRADDGREDDNPTEPRVIRGGTYQMPPFFLRTANRYRIFPHYATLFDLNEALNVGIRVAASNAPGEVDGSSEASPMAAASSELHRMQHPPMNAYRHKDPPPPSAQDDVRYRLKSGNQPVGVILGYPATREREARYAMPWERLFDLELARRDFTVPRDIILGLLHLKRGQIVADVGAGSGYFTARFSEAVGLSGQVWATDIAVSSLKYLMGRLKRSYWWHTRSNVRFVLHDVTDCLLPANHFDLIFMSEVHYYHYPRARNGVSPPVRQVVTFYRSIARALKSDGRLVIWEESDKQPQQDPDRGTLSPREIADQLRRAGLKMTFNRRLSIPQEDAPVNLPLVREFMVFRREGGNSGASSAFLSRRGP